MRLTKSGAYMIIKSKCIVTICIPVRNWGYLENWKSTAGLWLVNHELSSVIYSGLTKRSIPIT